MAAIEAELAAEQARIEDEAASEVCVCVYGWEGVWHAIIFFTLFIFSPAFIF